MRIDIITAHPELLEGPFAHSILKRAQNKGLISIFIHNLRDYADNKHKSLDDYQYGGGSGMVMKIEPFALCIEELKSKKNYDHIIYTSPDGEPFNQKTANNLSMCNALMILCGHYKGIDQRVRDLFVTKEISLGDYVLTGGELPAAVITDTIARLIPEVISDHESALSDSFQDGLLEGPLYTRPYNFRGHKVPDILLGGNASEIEKWRHEQALEKTKKLRPELLE